MNIFLLLRAIILCGFVGIGLYTDIKERKIYNKTTITGIALGIIFNSLLFATPHLESGLLFSIQGIALGLILFFVPFSLGGLGGGDLKLLAMIGAFQGWPFVDGQDYMEL